MCVHTHRQSCPCSAGPLILSASPCRSQTFSGRQWPPGLCRALQGALLGPAPAPGGVEGTAHLGSTLAHKATSCGQDTNSEPAGQLHRN